MSDEEKATRYSQKQRRIDTLKKTRASMVRSQIKNSSKVIYSTFGGIFFTPKKKEKLSLFQEDQLGTRIVPIQQMTVQALQKACEDAVGLHEKEKIRQEELELILDMIFVEIAKRVNSGA